MMTFQPISRMCLTLLFLVPVAFGPSVLTAQGLTLQQETRSSGMMGRGGGLTKSTLIFGADAMRQSSPQGDMIVFLKEGRYIIIDHKKKTYSETTAAKLEAIMSEAVDEEQMKALRQMMGGSSQVSVRYQGPGEPVAGYETKKYVVSGPMAMQIWASPDVPVPTAYYDAMKLRSLASPMFDMQKMYDEMKKIDGMSMKTVTEIKMAGFSMTSTTEVTSVKTGNVPADAFQIPSGYRSAPFKLR